MPIPDPYASTSRDRDATISSPPRDDSSTATFGPPAEADEVGTLGPYRVLKQLGAGGMGAVYLALDARLDRKLALKVMLPEFAADTAAKERFLREAKAVAKISHDNVVTVFEADVRDGVPYIAMQLLQGQSLDEYMKQTGVPDLPHILRIAREAALGLAAAHALGLVHRDIKPANLWLESPNGRVKVLDFGLAKPIGGDAELTKSGVVVGTPAYMSPEQARGLKVDHRTDLFSLGAVLYRLCTGKAPFAGPSVMAVLMALGSDDPTPVRELNPSVPVSLAALVHQLLAKRPEDRFQAATDVAERLHVISDPPLRPLVVPPPPVQPREGRPQWLVAPFDRDRAKVGQRHWAAYLGVQVVETFTVGQEQTGRGWGLFGRAPKPIQMTFVFVPSGTFWMGNENGDENEKPRHQVTLTRGFFMAATPVTQAQWRAVMGEEFPHCTFKGPDLPVDGVTWEGCQVFCQRLTEVVSGRGDFRLPTEAEWEYACRAGTSTNYHGGDGAAALGKVAWYKGNSGGSSRPVGQLAPNAWGLRDMHGNVWEWVLDWEGPYPREHAENPMGPARGFFRVLRGGSWAFGAKSCGASVRNWFEESHGGAPTPSELRGDPPEPNDDIGFRPVLTILTD